MICSLVFLLSSMNGYVFFPVMASKEHFSFHVNDNLCIVPEKAPYALLSMNVA